MHRLSLADKYCLDFPHILQNTSITRVYQNRLSIIQRKYAIWKYEQDTKGRRKNKFNTQELKKDKLGQKKKKKTPLKTVMIIFPLSPSLSLSLLSLTQNHKQMLYFSGLKGRKCIFLYNYFFL